MTQPIGMGPGLPPSPPRGEAAEPRARRLTPGASPDNRVAVVDKEKVDPQVRRAAEGMEAMFLDYMMKVMRQSVPESEYSMRNNAVDLYEGMRDSEFAQKAAHQGGIGLADQIIAYFEGQRYTQGTGRDTPPPAQGRGSDLSREARTATGGIHAGQPNKQ